MYSRTRRWAPGGSLRFAAAALIALTGWIVGTDIARADERVWTVKEVSGAVRMHHNGAGWAALKAGDRVQPGSRVETATDGRLILVRPGDSIDVAPNSRFDIPFKNEPNAKAPAHILQTMGTLLFKITTRPENPFGVKTPYLAAVIKGTTFTVSVDGPKSALHVSHGAVEVTSVLTGEAIMVRPGMTAAIDGANGGRMQVIGQRRGDAGGKKGEASGKAAAKSEAAQSRGTVIPRTVGMGRVNVFESSRGLVRETRGGAGNDHGHAGVNGNGKAISGAIAGTVGLGHDSGGGNGLALAGGKVVRNGGGLGLGGGNGGGLGLGVGNGGGLGLGVGNGGGNGGGLGLGGSNGKGPGLGLGSLNGNGKGKGKRER